MVVLEFIKSVVPSSWRETPSGWISGNCPMCVTRGHNPDTKKRGGFRYDDDKFRYHCFNCGFTTGWSPGKKINDRMRDLLLQFGAEVSQIQRINLELLREFEASNIAKQFITQEEVQEFVNVSWTPRVLPPKSARIDSVDIQSLTSSELEKYINAVQYIHDRGLDCHSEWYWTPHVKRPFYGFHNRIILPFYYKGDIVGFTARWVGDVPHSAVPKYYSDMGSNMIYNLDGQTKKKYVIATEGPLDAVLTDGIAFCGSSPSKIQANIVNQLGKEIIVLPDADEAGMKLVHTALKYNWAVSFPEWDGCKDVGDAVAKYGRLFTVRSILDSVYTNPVKIEILAKNYCK